MADTHRIIERAARAGYLTKGVLYVMVGALSVHAAAQGGGAAGSGDAARTAAAQPFGTVLVSLIAIGLFGYALWKALQAAYDTEHKGTQWKGVATRLGYAVSALIHLALAWTCTQLALGQQSGGNRGNGVWVDKLLQSDFGPALLVIIGGIVIAFGCVQFFTAYKKRYLERLRLDEASHGERRLIDISGRVGHGARGIVFLVVGLAFVRGGLQSNGAFDQGVEGALNEIAASPAGPWGLAIVSAGLFLYGAFLVAAARYRQVAADRVATPRWATT